MLALRGPQMRHLAIQEAMHDQKIKLRRSNERRSPGRCEGLWHGNLNFTGATGKVSARLFHVTLPHQRPSRSRVLNLLRSPVLGMQGPRRN